jgi:hypothetical protein
MLFLLQTNYSPPYAISTADQLQSSIYYFYCRQTTVPHMLFLLQTNYSPPYAISTADQLQSSICYFYCRPTTVIHMLFLLQTHYSPPCYFYCRPTTVLHMLFLLQTHYSPPCYFYCRQTTVLRAISTAVCWYDNKMDRNVDTTWPSCYPLVLNPELCFPGCMISEEEIIHHHLTRCMTCVPVETI